MKSEPVMLSVSQQTVRLIRRQIFSGILKPGDRVVEAKIAQELGISRGPVREAIKELENDGLIVSHPRKGSYVIELVDRDIEEILTLRALLEGHAVTMAIDNLKDDDIKTLEEILDDMNKHALENDVLGVAQLNMQFHEEVCKLSGHQRLHSTWKTLLGPIRMFSAMTTEFYTDVKVMRAHHDDLLDSLIKRDKAYAKDCFEKHILNSLNELLQYLSRAREEKKS